MAKTMGNTNPDDVKKQTSDVKFFSDGDTWKPLSKASSESEGWVKSCKVMEIPFVGCCVQVTTQLSNPDGSYSVAEAVTFVPNVEIEELHNEDGSLYGRRLIYASYNVDKLLNG